MGLCCIWAAHNDLSYLSSSQANSEYQEVLQKLEMLTTGYNAMYQERAEVEEQERRIAEEKLREGLIRVRERKTRFILCFNPLRSTGEQI